MPVLYRESAVPKGQTVDLKLTDKLIISLDKSTVCDEFLSSSN